MPYFDPEVMEDLIKTFENYKKALLEHANALKVNTDKCLADMGDDIISRKYSLDVLKYAQDLLSVVKDCDNSIPQLKKLLGFKIK